MLELVALITVATFLPAAQTQQSTAKPSAATSDTKNQPTPSHPIPAEFIGTWANQEGHTATSLEARRRT